MADASSLSPALRAHDVHQGLHAADIDRGGGLIAKELHVTQQVGMAAALATAIKGMEVVSEASVLRVIAGEQLDIPPLAFDSIVELLFSVDFVRNVQRPHGTVETFYETVPEDFTRLYETLDEVWRERNPGEIEQALLATVDDLSWGPRPLDELDLDPDAVEPVLKVGEAAEAVRIAPVAGRNIAYSPFFAYEHPDTVGDSLTNVDVARVREIFASVRGYQGLPVSKSPQSTLLTGLVAAGLVAGPTVERPDGSMESFAVAPYGQPPELLTTRKPILNKALAILAGVRMGEHFGGITSIFNPIALLRALSDGRVIGPHSSARRQYAVLHRLGIVRFQGSRSMASIQLIDNADNREAVRLAIDLAAHGEAILAKEARVTPAQLLLPAGIYRSPVQAIKPARKRYVLPDLVLEELQESLMGQRPID
jgi:hypothetical protein